MAVYSKKEKLKIEVSSVRAEREHFHQDVELLFVLEGALDVTVGEQVTHMKEEDILVINANKKHCLEGNEHVLFVRLYITYQLISDIFESTNIIFWCDSTRSDSERYDELRDTMKQLLNHYLSTQGGVANFGHIALCYQVMDILSVHFLVKSGDRESMDNFDKFEDRIAQINNYIRANYNQPISMKDLSEKLYLSNGYLSRFFKKNYGMSFADYLTNVRLFHAADDLLYSNIPIIRVALDNGFANVAVFNKAFKSVYGETPSAFRKNFRESKHEEIRTEDTELLEERLEQFLRNDGIRQEQRKTIENRQAQYSVKSNTLTKYFWNDMINIGSAEDLLKSEVREHVIFLKEALHFQYIRFWNIFSEKMLIDIDGNSDSFNFSRVDSILDFLLENDLKPHIELGRKPKRVFRNVQNTLIYESADIYMVESGRWKYILDEFMRHLIHRYGRKELKKWRIELWLREDVWNLEDAAEEYFELFEMTYEIIHNYSKELQVGGCGFRLDMLQHVQNFMEKWKGRKIQPDFFSFMYYAYERGEVDQDRYSKRMTDNEGVLHLVGRTNSMLEELGMRDIPVLFTEWNLTISDRNYINDTCFKGAYVVKNILDVYGEIDSMAYFLGSDRVSEYFDSGDMLYGGLGIFTKNGIMKPAAFAFDFLNRLYPYYVGKGENYLITTDSTDIYGIVCHNQKKLNYNYYLSKEDEIDRENTWKYYENRDDLELRILLTDMEPGTYQIKTYRVNENNGSVLDIWSDMDFESEISRNDIKYFRRVCEPKLTIQKVPTEENNLRINIIMEPNEIAFIRARRVI